MQEKAQNPLLSNVKLPGRTFTLPSGGHLYRDGELTNPDGEIHIQALSALDEITLKNSDLLFNGDALEQVVRACVPSIKKPSELYGRDVDALMVMLRLVTYGPEFSIKVAHDCEASRLPNKDGETTENSRHREHDYIVDIESLVMNMKQLDPTDISKQYVTTLDNGQVVKVGPVRYKDLISLFQYTLAKKDNFTAEDVKESTVKNIAMVVQEVDGISDKALIEEWARYLTTKQNHQIADIVEQTNTWGPDNTVTLKCQDCGEEFKVELPLNPISFFTE